MPVESYSGTPLPYSLGIQDLAQLGLGQFDLEAFREIPFFVLIGEEDTNTPLVRGRESGSSRFDMSVEQIVWYLDAFGDSVQERSLAFHEELLKLGMNSTFTEYSRVGHSLTSQMKNDVIAFFMRVLGRDTIHEVRASTSSPQESEVAATIDWSGPLRSGVPKEIEITIHDEDYISWENGTATTRFAVASYDSLGWGSVIQGFADKTNWSLPSRFFEEVQVPLAMSGVGWCGVVTIVPDTSMRYLSVLQPPQPNCPLVSVWATVDGE